MIESKLLFLVASFTAVASLIQFAELLWLRQHFSSHGIWRWRILQKDLRFFGFLLGDSEFPFILLIGLLSSIGLFIDIGFAVPLLVCQLLVALRFRGTFNGGSDFMTVLLLVALSFSLTEAWVPLAPKISLIYIGIQSVLSYFISGVAKIRNPDWWNGTAVRKILTQSNYHVPQPVKNVAQNSSLMFVMAWVILFFEVGFPLGLTSLSVCLCFLFLGFLFHLGNTMALGLNRFLFAWIASYPAILYCAWLAHKVFSISPS